MFYPPMFQSYYPEFQSYNNNSEYINVLKLQIRTLLDENSYLKELLRQNELHYKRNSESIRAKLQHDSRYNGEWIMGR